MGDDAKVISHKRKTPQGWKKGKPPSIGWWPASKRYDINTIRWWDGKHWSMAFRADREYTEHELNFWVRTWENIKDGSQIYWHERPKTWPQRSRT